jgi:hypothetical protein
MFTAKDGKDTSSFNGMGISALNLDTPFIESGSAKRLLRQSTEQVRTKPVPEKFTGEIVVTPDCLGDFLGFITGDISDGKIISKTSIYKKKLNQQITDPRFTLYARPVSDEITDGYFITDDGYVAENSTIIDKGVLKTHLLSLYGANKTGGQRAVNGGGAFVVDDTSLKIKFIETMILINEKLYTFAYSNTVDNFDNELSKFNESLDSFKILSQEIPEEPVTENGGGCLIATATYGSEMALEVQQLRELRDNTLLQTESGTNFMNTFNDIYYSFSPVIADYERENPVFKEVVKLAITPMISSLSILNYVDMDSESSVLRYGISLILLNLGMYLGIPAVVIIGIKKRN